MAKVESLKCPNCGAAVEGTGAVTCPYCGSALRVADVDKAHLKRIKKDFGTAGRALHAGETAYFEGLPGVAITVETKDVPFQPTVSYDKLAGGAPTGARRLDAEAILKIAETTQRAVNREDLELYMSTVDATNTTFAGMARRGATQQFITSDMKRFTLGVDFLALKPASATVDVTIDAIIFLNSGQTNHVQATFTYQLKKVGGEWKVTASAIKGKKLSVPAGAKVGIIVALGGLLVGIVAACVSLIATCAPEKDVTETTRNVPTEASDVPAPTEHSRGARPDTKGFYTAKTGIPLYRLPATTSDVTGIITPGAKFRILRRQRDWVRVEGESGAKGWVPGAIIDANLAKSRGGP